MKIILSPSKTKALRGNSCEELFHKDLTQRIVSHMQTLTAETIGKALKIKPDKAAMVKEFFDNYESMPSGIAVESYSGLAFKNLDWNGLDTRGQDFGVAHLVILSALYGVVTPLMPVKDYRLDLVDPILKEEKTNLYEWWQPSVNAYFQQEDWILNLASKEYSKLVNHPMMVTVEFVEEKNGMWKQMSTSSKIMRGRLAHEVLSRGITNISELPCEINGFILDGSLPTQVAESMTLVYKKQ